jgi:uncharacterized coiled-coil protein SlyX
VEVEEAGGVLVVGNRRGLNLARQLAAQNTKIAALDTEIAALDTEIAAQDTKIAALQTRTASLEGQVAGLTASVDAYKSVRNRFISTYRRDVLKNDTDADRRIIAAGSASAHGGDAVADALLYKHGARSDYHIYTKLYGIDPRSLETISERAVH